MALKTFSTFAEALKSPERVRRLSVIIASRRTELPDFRLFPALEELTLLGKLEHVTRFPTIFGCTEMRALTLTGTSITKIPPGLANLQRLETLVLVGNRRLTTLPDDLVELSELRHMRVDHNCLKRLPERIGRLRSLAELVAYDNAIRELPPSIYTMKKLRWLELQGNRLVGPPTQLMKMKGLRHLQTDFDEIRRGVR